MQNEIEALERSISNLHTTPAVKLTNFEELYKNWGRLGNQEERRKELLEVQRSKRLNKIDSHRGILQLVNAIEENKVFNTNKALYKPKNRVAGFNRTCLTYSNVLMLSEWMIEKPEKFSEDWLLVLCPKGIRTLIVSNEGTTKFYTKFGQQKYEFQTALPGGNIENRKGCCVLDGFFYETTKTVYVLDLLAWNNQPMTDGETEFRQFWLRSQFQDIGHALQKISKRNEIIFKLLTMIPCTPELLNENLSKYPYFKKGSPPVDGLLFYHKNARYVAGETPLVGWLFAYMVPELISQDIHLHPMYAAEKPEDYINQKHFIQNFNEKMMKKKKKINTVNTMDVEEATAEKPHLFGGRTMDVESQKQPGILGNPSHSSNI